MMATTTTPPWGEPEDHPLPSFLAEVLERMGMADGPEREQFDAVWRQVHEASANLLELLSQEWPASGTAHVFRRIGWGRRDGKEYGHRWLVRTTEPPDDDGFDWQELYTRVGAP